MKLPFSLPTDTFYGALTFLGLASIIYAVLMPTEQFDLYKSMQRDNEQETALIAIERTYLERHQQLLIKLGTPSFEKQLAFLDTTKELDIRQAKLEVAIKRSADLKKAWEKTRRWSTVGGGIGLIMMVVGFWLWKRSEHKKSQQH